MAGSIGHHRSLDSRNDIHSGNLRSCNPGVCRVQNLTEDGRGIWCLRQSPCAREKKQNASGCKNSTLHCDVYEQTTQSHQPTIELLRTTKGRSKGTLPARNKVKPLRNSCFGLGQKVTAD